MSKRTFITIAIAVLAAALIGTLWFVFFHKAGTQPSPSGSFGTSQGRTLPAGQGQNAATNIPNTVAGGGAGSGVGPAGQGTQAGVGTPAFTISLPPVPTTTPVSTPNVNWVSGNSAAGAPIGTFSPTPVNQLNDGQIGGQVNVLGQYQTPSGGSLNNGAIIGALAGAAAGCLIFMAAGASGVLTSSSLIAVQTNVPTENNKNFLDCLARTIARAAIQQITNSVVNWINSGFNGQPSFVTNYQQFFASVADQAAGQFIQNYTNFAPFCTPFAKQIQIALAQSYARNRSGVTAPSCTLTQLLGTNIFQSSAPGLGWSNFVSFTTNPSNNPFGAYMTAQANLATVQAAALATANRNISPNGFISMQQPYDCKPIGGSGEGGGGTPSGSNLNCKYRTTTPGSVMEASLNKVMGGGLDSLNLAKSFDEIISALVTQLMTRALYSGVSNLSGQYGYASYYLTPDQQQAQSDGQQLLTTLQQLNGIAQQYGQAKQGSIQDIQNAESKLVSLINCWQLVASSTEDAAKQQVALTSIQTAQSQINKLEISVAGYNAEITRANAAIAVLQDLQTKVLNVASTADVAAIKQQLDDATAQGKLISPADVTGAQQDRATLQSQLQTINNDTDVHLNECQNFH